MKHLRVPLCWGVLLCALLGTATSTPVAGLAAGFTSPPGDHDSIYPLLGDPALDVTHYDLSLASDPHVDTLKGRAVLSIIARQPVAQVNLDFDGPAVTGVQVNGRAAMYVQQGAKLLIQVPATIPAGTAFTVAVGYGGTPALHLDTSDPTGLRLGWVTQAGSSYVLSEPDGAHTFFPCNDVPRDGATYSLHLDVPQGEVAVASGVQMRQVSAAGRTRTDFELKQEIPTYALTVHVGPLQVQQTPAATGGVPIRNAFAAALPDSVRAQFGRTPEMLSFLAGWFGPYPFSVYGVAVTPDPQIPALETATLSTFPARAQSPTVALHELAHQWFGDSVRLGDWSDVWLNEGFATFAELLWAEHTGQDTAALLKRWYARLGREPARGLVATTPMQLFDDTSYLRGALALQALRVRLGDAAFRQVLREYVRRYSGQSVRTADFLHLVREVGGDAGVEAMRGWVEGPDLPVGPPPPAPTPQGQGG